MTERLTVAVDDGTVERLRTLAGGERKVGAYLSDVATWLWAQRDVLSARSLSEFSLVTEVDAGLTVAARLDRLESKLDELAALTAQLTAQ